MRKYGNWDIKKLWKRFLEGGCFFSSDWGATFIKKRVLFLICI